MDIVANFDFEQQVLRPGYFDPGQPLLFLPHIFEPPVSGAPWKSPFLRSKLDATPPPQMAKRLGHYFLPNCASFKVEWALDPRSEFVGGRLNGEKQVYWFDQGAEKSPAAAGSNPEPLATLQKEVEALDADPAADVSRYVRLYDLMYAPLGGRGAYKYWLHQRFSSASDYRIQNYGSRDRTNLAVFMATRLDQNGSSLVPEDVFPGALRITVELFDKSRRLERPIRHVIVVPVGGS